MNARAVIEAATRRQRKQRGGQWINVPSPVKKASGRGEPIKAAEKPHDAETPYHAQRQAARNRGFFGDLRKLVKALTGGPDDQHLWGQGR